MRSIIPLIGLAAMSLIVSYALTSSTPLAAVPASRGDRVVAAPASTSGITLSTSSKVLVSTLFAPGDVITYTLIVSNSGVDKAFGVSVIDPLPLDLALLPQGLTATQGSIVYTGTSVSWNGAILPGMFAVITVPVTVTTCQWPVTNTAIISSPVIAQPVTVIAAPVEGFEGGAGIYTPTFPPPDWSIKVVTGTTAIWSLGISGTLGYPGAPAYDGAAVASLNAYFATSGDSARLATRALNFPADYTPRLTFWMYHDSDSPGANAQADRLQVQLSADGGSTYVDIAGASFSRYDGVAPNHWSLHTVDLPGHSGQNNIRIGLLGISDFGNNLYIDDIGLQYIPASGSIDAQSTVALINASFAFTGTTAGNTDQFTKMWGFGDGAAVLASKVVTHTYSSIGSYIVSMAVCGLNVTRTVYASGNLTGVDLAVAVSSPALMQESVYFTPTVTSVTWPVTATWDFGDGITATDLVVSHTYAMPGLYTATLTVSNTLGAVITTTSVAVLPVADLSIAQQAAPLPAMVAQPLTYTIVISNAGPVDATGVWFTDTLPVGASLSLQAISINGAGSTGCSKNNNVVTCTLGTLSAGNMMTISLMVRPGPAISAVNGVTVSAAAVDLQPASNTSSLTVFVNRAHVYVPFVLSHYPPIPDAPVLNPVDDPHANGTYTVSWNATPLAEIYILQESQSPTFTNIFTAHIGTDQSWSTQNKPAGTYYYRVMASNSSESSGWSNVQAVSFALPYDGIWGGTTSQNRAIGITVSQNRVDRFIFSFNNVGCVYDLDQQIYPALNLNGNSFTIDGTGATLRYVITGTFTSAANAVGSISMTSFDVLSVPQCIGTTTATWSATK